MVPDNWENRLCDLIKKYKLSEARAFRKEYREVLVRSRAQSKITEEAMTLLLEAGESLESWASPPLPDPAEAFDQWQKIYDSRKGIPSAVLQALLGRFPLFPNGAASWEAFVLTCSDPKIVDAVLRRRLLKKQNFVRIAKAQPVRFVIE